MHVLPFLISYRNVTVLVIFFFGIYFLICIACIHRWTICIDPPLPNLIIIIITSDVSWRQILPIKIISNRPVYLVCTNGQRKKNNRYALIPFVRLTYKWQYAQEKYISQSNFLRKQEQQQYNMEMQNWQQQRQQHINQIIQNMTHSNYFLAYVVFFKHKLSHPSTTSTSV